MVTGQYWDWSVRGRDVGGDARPILFNTTTFSALPQQRYKPSVRVSVCLLFFFFFPHLICPLYELVC